ncbi:hypothetical protein PCE1_000568 [Barthelona sp. PCE]
MGGGASSARPRRVEQVPDHEIGGNESSRIGRDIRRYYQQACTPTGLPRSNGIPLTILMRFLRKEWRINGEGVRREYDWSDGEI